MKKFKLTFIPRCSVTLLVGLSLLDVCLAISEKLNFGVLLKSGLFADAAAVDWNENVEDVFAVVVAVVANWNPVEDVLPKPGNENPLLVLVDSAFVNENLIFSLELNGISSAGVVDAVWRAKKKEQIINY